MEILYKNKLLVSIVSSFLISIVFYNYNKISENALEYTEKEINNNSNKNKNNSVYLFFLVSVFIFIILYFTEDNIDEVYNEIDVGDPPF
tara:strand:+ start:1632 stop:1898 length:267 start_codon:yes stop_codon:yes gene_type:complete